MGEVAILLLLGYAGAAVAGAQVSRKQYGWATFMALVSIAAFIGTIR